VNTEILVGERLRHSYGRGTVLDVERIALRSGELLAVLGPNGAGKSTLLRFLAMLEKPSSGRIAFHGRTGTAAEQALRAASAAVFQRPHFWRGKVSYNVGLGLSFRRVPVPETKARVKRICQLLEIDHLLQAEIETLSGGQAQRVALARALVLQPEVLFLDEPTASLDTAARADLREDLERVARQRAGSVLLITHDRNEAFTLADRIAVLVDGRLAQLGTPTELYENPADPYIARVTGAELSLRGRVLRADGRTLLVDVGGTQLSTVGDAGEGVMVKIAYRPEDLVLASPELAIGEISTRNLFFATVRERRDIGGLVRLRLFGPPEVVALVTRSAAEELDLRPEARVSVRIKATALHTYPAGERDGDLGQTGMDAEPDAEPDAAAPIESAEPEPPAPAEIVGDRSGPAG
jgi:molybdopterin-binding protein